MVRTPGGCRLLLPRPNPSSSRSVSATARRHASSTRSTSTSRAAVVAVGGGRRRGAAANLRPSSRTCSPAGPTFWRPWSRHGTRLIIIGKDQVYTDMPEYRNHPNPAYQNERVRGTGGSGRHQLRRGEPAQPRRSTATTTRASPSTNSATPSTPPWARIDPGWRGAWARPTATPWTRGLWKIRLHRHPTRPNTGPRSASPISTATASTTGTTPRSAPANSSSNTTPMAMNWSGRPSG